MFGEAGDCRTLIARLGFLLLFALGLPASL
jgi:hypothetical protein